MKLKWLKSTICVFPVLYIPEIVGKWLTRQPIADEDGVVHIFPILVKKKTQRQFGACVENRAMLK